MVIAGDGGFQMTMNELGTAVQHGANLLIIVVDNGVLGRVEFGFNDSQVRTTCTGGLDAPALVDRLATSVRMGILSGAL